jgi:hypothetical protein
MEGNQHPEGKGDPVPEGARIRREEDGTLILDLPVSRDRFLNIFLPLFSLPFAGAGLVLLLSKGDQVGFIPLGIGCLTGWFGLYMAIGRLEIRLGPERLEWTRVYLKRWSTNSQDRGSILSVRTLVGVRTNGRPTSWRLALNVKAPTGSVASAKGSRQRLLPGFHGERAIQRLGEILALWAQVPFDGRLDRSYDNSD